MTDYDVLIEEVFNRLTANFEKLDSYQFDKELLENVTFDLISQNKIDVIKNIADIKYTYDARDRFPLAIRQRGYWAILGRGKGRYTFQRISQDNLIDIHHTVPIENYGNFEDTTPQLVASVLGEDEQATMTRVFYNDLVSSFLKLETFKVQSHERTSLSCGQVEIDEIYVGENEKSKYVIPISAKGPGDYLSYTQALNLSLYGLEKDCYMGFFVKPLGIMKHANGKIYIVQFSCSADISKIQVERIGQFEFFAGLDKFIDFSS